MESHSQYASNEQYYSILYEDINRAPFEQAKDIFNFLGLKPNHEVNTWITANTRKHQKTRRDASTSLDMGIVLYNIRNGLII